MRRAKESGFSEGRFAEATLNSLAGTERADDAHR